jgi:hypothetical protein
MTATIETGWDLLRRCACRLGGLDCRTCGAYEISPLVAEECAHLHASAWVGLDGDLLALISLRWGSLKMMVR